MLKNYRSGEFDFSYSGLKTAVINYVHNQTEKGVEIVKEDCGFKWNTLEELVGYTEKLCKNEADSSAMISCAQQRSSAFSKTLLWITGRF